MLFTKLYLLAGLLNFTIDFIARVIKYLYKLLKLLHLRLLFTICAAGLLAELIFNLLTENATYLIVFITLVCVAAMRFLYIIFSVRVSASGRKFKRKEVNADSETEIIKESYVPNTTKPSKVSAVFSKPKYFRVAQNPKYVMAEYSDRYELFYDGESGLKHIRTDYKSAEDDINYGT